MNTHFKKLFQRKWTWKSPNNKVKNEINYILTNNKGICTDVSALNQFSTGSDHQLVRAKITINTRLERHKLTKKHIYPISEILEQERTGIQGNHLNETGTNGKSATHELRRTSREDHQHPIQVTKKSVCTRVKQKDSKLSTNTLALLEERRRTDRDTERYKTLNKTIRGRIR